MANSLEGRNHVFLDRLRQAVGVILELGADGDVLNSALETDLVLLKDQIERALLGQDGHDENQR